MTPSDPCQTITPPERFGRDYRRFHWRMLNGEYQVYSIDLEHWAQCPTQAKARAIADALEAFYAGPSTGRF